MRKDWKYQMVTKFQERFKGKISLVNKHGNIVTNTSLPIDKSNVCSGYISYPSKYIARDREKSVTPSNIFYGINNRNGVLPSIKKQLKKSISSLVFNKSRGKLFRDSEYETNLKQFQKGKKTRNITELPSIMYSETSNTNSCGDDPKLLHPHHNRNNILWENRYGISDNTPYYDDCIVKASKLRIKKTVKDAISRRDLINYYPIIYKSTDGKQFGSKPMKTADKLYNF